MIPWSWQRLGLSALVVTTCIIALAVLAARARLTLPAVLSLATTTVVVVFIWHR